MNEDMKAGVHGWRSGWVREKAKMAGLIRISCWRAYCWLALLIGLSLRWGYQCMVCTSSVYFALSVDPSLRDQVDQYSSWVQTCCEQLQIG
jgi:hypothetical protein